MNGRPGQSAVAIIAGTGKTMRAAALLAAAFLVTGCAINPRVNLGELSESGHEITLGSVPFYPQTDYQCGPAALAGVLGASGVEVTADQLSPQIYLPERKGSVQVELLAASRRAGRIPYILDPEPAALVRELESGRPVLVFQNLRTPQFPVWHYAVLTGFDPRANLFFLNTGEHQAREEDAGSFLRTWDWAGRWAVVVLQPGELPQDPDRLRYLQAIADFEGVAGPDAAEPAWRKAVAQWPQDHRPYLALGNAAYKSGDYAEAVSQFLNGLELKPDDAALENNLASALAQAGCPRVALARLKDLLEDLDRESPWYVDLSNTLNELSGSLGADSTDCPDYLKP